MLEKEIIGSGYEGALGENEVFSEDDNVKLARPSSEVDILDNDDVGQPSAKSQRRVIMPSASEDVVPRSRVRTRRPTPTQLRLAETHACRKVKSRHIMQEVSDSAKCNETTLQPHLPLDQWIAMGVGIAETEGE